MTFIQGILLLSIFVAARRALFLRLIEGLRRHDDSKNAFADAAAQLR